MFLGLLLLVSPFVYTEEILDPVFVSRILFFSAVLIPFVLYFLFRINKHRSDNSIFANTIVWVYLGYVLLTGVSVIMSINTGEGIWEFLRVCVFFILFITAVFILNDENNIKKLLPEFYLLFTIIILIFGSIQLIGILLNEDLNHQTSYQINSVFAHRNLFAQVLFFAISFLMMGVYFLKGFLRVVSVFLIALSLVFITLMLVKSVWLATIAATLTSFLLLIFFRKKFAISIAVFKKLIVYAFGASIIVLISVAVYSKYYGIETYEKQTIALQDYSYGSAVERVHLWEKSIEMFKEDPVIGHGAGNWKIHLPNYGTSGMRSSEGEIIYQRPHNDFLWVLAERGIITFGIYVLLFLLTLYYLISIVRKSPGIDDKIFALFLIFFMIGYVVFATLSFPSERPTHSMFLNLVFAITLIKYHKIEKVKNTMKLSGLNILLGLSVAILGFTIYVGMEKYKSEQHTKYALYFRNESKWQQVIQEIEMAENFFTRLDPTATPLRFYSGLAWNNLGNNKNAAIDFNKAYKANPYHMHVLNNLATAYGNQGDYTKAIELLTEAVQISPTFTDASFNLCATLFNVKKIDSAYMVLRGIKEGEKNPNYKNIVQALVYAKVEKLKQSVDDRDLKMTLTRIRNSNEWMIKVHEQAIRDKISLESHLIIESIYMLQTVDSAIGSERATYLRQKYLAQ